ECNIGVLAVREMPPEKVVKAGPLVGSLQSNVPQSVKRSFQQSDRIFAELMGKSRAAAAAGAELVIWPETMVQATIEPAVLKLLDASHSYRVFDSAPCLSLVV
ncbi:unnamed protein product, partial [marine sediment metagenome]